MRGAAFGRNSPENHKIPVSGYVRFQEDAPVCGLRYGFFPFSYNGCEVLACYHALLSAGKPRPLADVLDDFTHSGIWLCGLFGTYPHALARYLRKQGLTVSHLRRGQPPSPDTVSVICTFWNPRFRGIHTVELHKTPRGWVVTNHRGLYGRYFADAREAIGEVRTAGRILVLEVFP